MLRDITIGQYYPTNSVIHRIDPRVKLLATVVFVLGLFLVKTFIAYFFVAAVLGAIILVSRVPLVHIVKGLRFIIILLLISVSFNLFLTDGEHMLYEYGIIKISLEGIKWAAFMAMRLILIIIGCSLMTYTTTPNELTGGLEKGLAPLNKIKIPVHEIAMMMSIALRFIPILVEEADKIMKAQSARGADFESGNIIVKAKSLIPVIVPLFISSFRRASDLAIAMESRCYRGGEGRTKYHPLVYAKRDKIAYILMALFLALTLVIDFIVRNIDALSMFMSK